MSAREKKDALQMTAQELAGMREPCVRQGEADEAETLRPDERYSEAEINQCSDFAASRLRVKPDLG